MKLPIELIENIFNYLDFDKIAKLSNNLANRLCELSGYDFDNPYILDEHIEYGNLYIIKM